MKYLDLNELAKAMAKKADVSLGNAERFVNAQDEYFDKTGVNVKPEDGAVAEHAVVSDEDMMKYIIETTGMSESFARRLADAERAYMEEKGLITDEGVVVPFMKGRGPKA